MNANKNVTVSEAKKITAANFSETVNPNGIVTDFVGEI